MDYPSPDLQPNEGDLRHSWRQINESRAGGRQLDRQRRQANETVQDRRRLPNMALAGFDLHPFKVYLAQLAFGAGAMTALYADTTTWWRIFLVRCGEILSDPLTGDGCDNYNEEPDSDWLDGTGLTPIEVPADSAAYYLWVDNTGAHPALMKGVEDDVPDAWLSWPNDGENYWLIAMIDTTEPYEATVRQYLRADVESKILEVLQMKVQSETNDYLVCQAWDGDSLSGIDLEVAKPPELRGFTAHQSSAYDPGDGSITDVQYIFPYYTAGDVIYACEPSGGTGVLGDEDQPVTWLDLNVAARAIAVQFHTCEATGGKYRLFISGPAYTVALLP